jgi:pilus assembly protein Flp/PilA
MLDYLRIILAARLARIDERGASAVEYALLISGIAALICLIVYAFGGVVSTTLFGGTCNTIASHAGQAACQ